MNRIYGCTVGRISGNIHIGDIESLLSRSKDLLFLCPKVIEERTEKHETRKNTGGFRSGIGASAAESQGLCGRYPQSGFCHGGWGIGYQGQCRRKAGNLWCEGVCPSADCYPLADSLSLLSEDAGKVTAFAGQQCECVVSADTGAAAFTGDGWESASVSV